MGFFDVLAFLLGGGFLVAAFVRQRVVGTEAFQQAMWLFFAALILHDLRPQYPLWASSRCPSGMGLRCGASAICAWP